MNRMQIRDLTAHYRTLDGLVLAVQNVTFDIFDNEIFGIAGESGCGKSTLLKSLYDIIRFPLELTKGKVELLVDQPDGTQKAYASGNIKEVWWKKISYVPQAAMSVLNPVKTIEDQFFDVVPYKDKKERAEKRKGILAYLEGLDLPTSVLSAYPHQLSGGMRQRVVIALAMFEHPQLVLADEPTTALDVVVQRGILTMLTRLQKEYKNTMVFVSHDMGVHYQITDRMAIMYAGSIIELGKTEDIFERPQHPYTQLLISALPRVGDRGQREGISGAPPSLRNSPPGCRFAPRCPKKHEGCESAVPGITEVFPGHFAACNLFDNAGKKGGAKNG